MATKQIVGRNKRQRLVFSEKVMYSFISDYRENSCLWDIKNPDYKCVDKRIAALSKLAAKYDISMLEAKKKINSLRSTFLQEKKKVEESKRAGNGDVYEPSLYWYHELEFLYDVIIPRSLHPSTSPYSSFATSSSSPAGQSHAMLKSKTESEVINQEVDQEHLIFEFVPDGNEKTIFAQKLDSSSFDISHPLNSKVWRKQRRRPLIKKSPSLQQQHQISDHSDLPLPRLQPHERSCHSPQSFSQIQHEDEFDAFCSSIASQLRTLPTADAIEMQLEIQQLVSRRRLAILKHQQNLSLFRTWENGESDHQYLSHTSPMNNGNVQEERSEKLILEQ